MSMREHQIVSAYTRFIEEDDEQVIGMISKTPQASMPVAKRNFEQYDDESARLMIGHASARTGATILLVPDPLPFVDEAVGAALLAGGVYLIESER